MLVWVVCKDVCTHPLPPATKIDLYIGELSSSGKPVSIEAAHFRRLGYVSLSDNEATGYRVNDTIIYLYK